MEEFSEKAGLDQPANYVYYWNFLMSQDHETGDVQFGQVDNKLRARILTSIT